MPFKTALKKDDTITLLKAGAVNGPNKVEGDSKNDPNGYWTVADLDSVNKELVLTAKKAFSVPELVAKVTASGNERVVNVTVSNDVDVVVASWRAELLSVVAPDSVKSVALNIKFSVVIRIAQQRALRTRYTRFSNRADADPGSANRGG